MIVKGVPTALLPPVGFPAMTDELPREFQFQHYPLSCVPC